MGFQILGLHCQLPPTLVPQCQANIHALRQEFPKRRGTILKAAFVSSIVASVLSGSSSIFDGFQKYENNAPELSTCFNTATSSSLHIIQDNIGTFHCSLGQALLIHDRNTQKTTFYLKRK